MKNTLNNQEISNKQILKKIIKNSKLINRRKELIKENKTIDKINSSKEVQHNFVHQETMSQSQFQSTNSSLSSLNNSQEDSSFISEYQLEQIGSSSNSSIYCIINSNCEAQILKVIQHESNKSDKKINLGDDSCSNHSHECHHLENEFKQLKRLNHPNIIQLTHNSMIKDTLIQKNTNHFGCCILLEKGNCDLLQMLSSVYPKVLEISYFKYCFKKIASALLYLHEDMKIAHNDIKLENIILFNTEPKISDFGFAQKHEQNSLNQVKNWLQRSKKNVAPEIIENIKKVQLKQINDLKVFDERKTDVFAFGIALFNALFHQNPFTKMADASDSLYSHFYNENGNFNAFWEEEKISRMLEFLSTFDNSMIPELKNLFEGMLNPNPKQRLSIKQVLSHAWFNF